MRLNVLLKKQLIHKEQIFKQVIRMRLHKEEATLQQVKFKQKPLEIQAIITLMMKLEI